VICIAIEKVLSFVICIANIPGLWILRIFPLFPSLLPVVATEKERVWFCQKGIKGRGPGGRAPPCDDTRDYEKGGNCVWYDETALLKEVFLSLLFSFFFLYYDRGGNGVRYNEMFLWQCFFHFSLFYNDKGGLLCVVKRDLSPQEVYLSLFFFFLHFLCYHKRGNSVW